ncbi:MAG: cobalamin-binding protein [Gammaproteobacteria bacterium]|nr:cobalamin-binding protein [Gammaproteobacteria bacterium]
MNAGERLILVFALSGLLACTEAPQPARPASYSRLVTLAPNLTELVFAAGAGDNLVGVSAYSDYPPAARDLPVVGDAFTVDQERLALLDPDALLVWQSGTPTRVVDDLRRIGYHVEVIRTRNIDDVAAAIAQIGRLTGHQAAAEKAAAEYVDGLNALRRRFAAKDPVRVFYQVSRRPLFTVNGSHFVSNLIELCGGQNIFADLDELAPTIDVEAVVARDPEAMLASDASDTDAFAEWDRWPNIAANRYRNRYLMPADEIGRATPRLLIAAEAVCSALDEARARRATAMAALN